MIKGKKARYVVFIALFVVIGVSVIAVIAQNIEQPSDVPVLPAVYYGEITIGNKEVKDGLKVEAFVDGKSCGQKAETVDGMYLVVVRGNDVLTPGCASAGDDVRLVVNDVELADVKWSSGLFARNDIKLEPKDLKGDISGLVREGPKTR